MITSQNPASSYAGNGAATTFAYSFQVSDPSYLTVTSSASTNPLVLNQDYTVNGVGQTNASLWTITMAVAPANGVTITITPNIPLTQQTNFSGQDNFYPEVVEAALDKLTLITQQQQLILGDVGNISTAATSAEAAATSAEAASTQAQAYAAALGSVTNDPYDQMQYGAATGTNTYAATLTPAPTSYTLGMSVVIKFANGNTGAATLNLNALGAINIYYLGSALVAGQIAAGQVAHLTYDGTNFNLLDPALEAETTYPADSFLANLSGGVAAPTAVTPLQVQDAINLPYVAVASAASAAIGGAASNYVYISGATNINSFDTVASGVRRTLMFEGALTLTYNAVSLILPGGQNITTAAGDVALFVSEGGGNWRCLSYQTFSGLPISAPADSQLNVAVLTASGTWVVPAGVTAVKVTVAGGGGAGGGGQSSLPGAAGGTTTFSTVSATGGGGGAGASATPSTPGVGSGGLLNLTGSAGAAPSNTSAVYFAGQAPLGLGSPGYRTSSGGYGATGYGCGGGGASNGSSSGQNGAGAGATLGYLTGLTPGTGITYTIGAAGTGPAGSGSPGVVILEW